MAETQLDTYVVPVNYDLPHQQQIEAGKFDWITNRDNNLIRKLPTEHVVPVGSGEVEQRITLVNLNYSAMTEKVLAEMEKLNLRPAISTETLAFLAARPEVQRMKFPIIGLGSVWRDSGGCRRFLVADYEIFDVQRKLPFIGFVPLWMGSGGSRLGWCLLLGSGVLGWGIGCRFLAVQK